MTRYTFGGYGGDQVTQSPSANAGVFKAAGSLASTGTFWSAQTGGTQYTDLIDPNNAGAPITGVSTDANGRPLAFQGPNGVTEGWLDFGGGRFKIQCVESGLYQTAAGLDAASTNLITTPGTSTRAAGYAVFGKKIAFDVTDPTFGADPTGAADSAAAFAAAHNAAGDGGTVLVPTGTYKLASTFVISKDIILRGMGRSKTVLMANAGVTAIKTDQVGSDIPQNWQIRDLTVQSASGTSGKLANPVVTLGTTATSGGTFTAATYYWAVSAINAVGETLAETEVSAAIAANGTQVLNWSAITGATGYKVYRGTSSYNYGATALVATLGTVTTYTDTGTATTTGAPLDTATASGSDNGIYNRWGPGVIENVDVNYFGSHGIRTEASSSLGSTQASHTRYQNVKCYGNGGDGVRHQGQDAQACVLDQVSVVANYGWGVKIKDCSSNVVTKPHADQQYNGAPGAFWDNAISNTWLSPYSEGSKRLRLHTGVSSPVVILGLYGRPVLENPSGVGYIIDGETGFNTFIRFWNGTNSYAYDVASTALSAWTLKYTGTAYGAKTVHSYYRVFDQWWWYTHLVGGNDATWDLGASGNRWRDLWANQWVRPSVTKTANYTITSADNIVIFNGTSLTATLPDPTTAGLPGRVFVVKNIAATSLTVSSAGTSKTLDGAASQTLAQWAKASYTSDGTQWLTV